MDRTVPAILIGVVLLAVLALMLRSWRGRTRRDAALAPGYPAPAGAALGAELASAAAFYVATTRRARQLERLNIRGLGFRARARLTVTEAGVLLDLAGEPAVFIPADAIVLVEDATWTIDRAVEPGGLLLLAWRLDGNAGGTGATGGTDAAGTAPTDDDTVVDSYFRIIDPSERDRVNAALRTIAAGALRPAAPDESEA